MSKLLGRFQALESDVTDEPIVNDEVDETGAQLDGTEIAEGDMVEAGEHLDDVTEADGEAEELTQTTEALESWLDLVSTARRDRTGLTKREAHGIFVGLNNDMRRHGHTVDDLVDDHNVSIESFDGGRDSISRCLSLENAIMDAIKSFWDKIKQAISKMIKSVREWYLKHLDGASRMKKRAEALRDKANQTNGTAKENKVSLSVHRQLSDKKAVSDASKITAGLKSCATVLDGITAGRQAEAFSKGLDDIETNANAVMESKQATASFNLAQYGKSLMTPGITDQPSYNSLLGAEGTDKAVGTVELPGHKAFMGLARSLGGSNALEEAESLKQAADVNKLVVRYTSDKVPEIESSKDYKVLKPSEAGALCSETIKVLDVIIGYKANFDKYEGVTKKFLAKMDTIYKKTIKEDDAIALENAKIGRLLGGAGAANVRGRMTSITNVSGYSMGLCRATLVYVQQSLAQYKA